MQLAREISPTPQSIRRSPQQSSVLRGKCQGVAYAATACYDPGRVAFVQLQYYSRRMSRMPHPSRIVKGARFLPAVELWHRLLEYGSRGPHQKLSKTYCKEYCLVVGLRPAGWYDRHSTTIFRTLRQRAEYCNPVSLLVSICRHCQTARRPEDVR